MKHTLLNVWGFFPYLWKEENDITMETSLGFRHFPIESSLVEESFGQARYQSDTHQSTWQKKPQNLRQVSWNRKTPTFRASITKVPENTQNRPLLPGRPHRDFAHMLQGFEKVQATHLRFGVNSGGIFCGFFHCLEKHDLLRIKMHQSSWSVGLFGYLRIYLRSVQATILGGVLSDIGGNSFQGNDVQRCPSAWKG